MNDVTLPKTDGGSDSAAAERARRLRPCLASPCCLRAVSERDGGSGAPSLACTACGRSFPIVRGVPILLPEVSRDWREKTEQKLRFAAKPSWRRRLLNPEPTSKFLQNRRLGKFLSQVPAGGLAMDVGASLRRLSSEVLCLDLIPTTGVDLVGDLHRLPLVEQSLDAVICTGVLEHVEDPDRVVAELWRILKPGGRVYVSLPFLQGYHPSPTDFHRFTREGARRLMSRFEIVELVNTRGSGSAITWILSSFLAELVSFGSRRAYGLAKALFGWLLLPIKYLDYWLATNPFDHYITSGFTVVGRKGD